jgi:hypothetical protein
MFDIERSHSQTSLKAHALRPLRLSASPASTAAGRILRFSNRFLAIKRPWQGLFCVSLLNGIRFLKISKIAIAGSAMPIRRIGFGFKVYTRER